MLVFVHTSAVPRMEAFIKQINGNARVSDEVLSIHLATPTRDATKALSEQLRIQPELQTLERIERLRPNNLVRDLTVAWRLDPEFVTNHMVLLNLETVNPDFRKKYPDPNLTLPAGGIEEGELPCVAAHRELFEEARVRVHPHIVGHPIALFRGGIKMYTVVVGSHTPLHMYDGALHIGFPRENQPDQSAMLSWTNQRVPRIRMTTNHIPHFGESRASHFSNYGRTSRPCSVTARNPDSPRTRGVGTWTRHEDTAA